MTYYTESTTAEGFRIRTWTNGPVYMTHDLLAVGDYGGSGSVGAANIAYLEALTMPRVRIVPMSVWDAGEAHISYRVWEPIEPTEPLIITTGPYSYRQAWVRVDGEYDTLRETLEGLEGYAVLNDSYLSEIESEWEEQHYTDTLEDELLRTLPEPLRDWLEVQLAKGSIPGACLWSAYREAMENTNTYPEMEYNGAYVDVERIADEWRGLLLRDLRAYYSERKRAGM